MVSIAFAVVSTTAFVCFPRWRLGVFLVYCLGAPPYLDYELAVVAQTAFRSGTGGIRAEITQPIFSGFDVLLAVGLAVSLPAIARNGWRVRLPLWFIATLMLLTLVGCLASSFAAYTYPEWRSTALAGLISVVRVPCVVVIVATLLSNYSGVTETASGLVIGTALFMTQSVYITFVKYGTLNPGSFQLTGLVPGPGATGGVLLLLAPILLGLSYEVRGTRLRAALRIDALSMVALALLTYTRSVILGLAIGMLVFLAVMIRRNRRLFLTMSSITSVLVVALSRYSPAFFWRKMVSVFSEDITARINLGARLEFWGQASVLIRDNWQFGIGPLMWGIVAQGYGSNAHNAYIQYATETGMIGGLLLISVFGGVTIDAVLVLAKTWKRHGRLLMGHLGMMSGLLGYLVSQLFSNSFSHFRMTALVWMIVTIMLVARPSQGGSSWFA